MRLASLPFLLLLGWIAVPHCDGSEPRPGGSIHATVKTTGDETLEGSIRWGRSRFWDESLEATEAPADEDSRDTFRFRLFGWTLLEAGGDRVTHRIAVPFGHLRAVESVGRDRAVLELKGGERIPVEASGHGVGPGRDLVVDVPGRGQVELPWRRVVRVEFASGPTEVRESQRLFGTVTTRTGPLRGFVEWDRDETTADETLDGEDEDGRERDFKFGEIAAIEPAGPSAARVALRSGTTVTLAGTNDVNRSNRGTVVHVDGLGTVVVEWDDLVRVEFLPAPPPPPYDRFDGGRRLRGEVRSAEGTVHRGAIAWDRDERYTWETLDGELDGLDYRIPFALVRSITRAPSGGSEVLLRDGRGLILTGTNDVDVGHRGVVVTDAGGAETTVEWDDLVGVELD